MKYGVSCNLFLKPIHWFSYWTTSHDPSARVSTPASYRTSSGRKSSRTACRCSKTVAKYLGDRPKWVHLVSPPGTVNFICVVSIWIYDIVLGGVDRYEQGWTKYVQCLQNTWKQGCMTFLNLFLYLHLGAWYFYVCFVTVWWLRKLEIPKNCPKANGLGMSWGITRISTAWYLVSLVHHISIVLFFSWKPMNGLNDVFQHPDITLMPSHTASAVPLGNATSQSLWSWPRWDMPWSRGLSLSLDAMFWANDFQLSSHLHFFLFEMLLQFGVCTMNPAHALQWILLSTSGFWFLQWTVVGNHLNHHGFFCSRMQLKK